MVFCELEQVIKSLPIILVSCKISADSQQQNLPFRY